MRVRIDENVSRRVASALKGFMVSQDGFVVDHVRDHHPPGTSDPSWIRQFAAEGGHAIVSGDARILQHWPDLVAYMESGLVSFFPPAKFDDLKGPGQAALIMRWWPAIVERAKASSASQCWRLPLDWNPDLSKFKELKDPRFATDAQRVEQGIAPAMTRHPFRPGDLSGTTDDQRAEG
ncbi:hypothetical protein [Brevundimonas sp. PWP3-1b1]|uniref:PIN-like domain-containing protein n=1 Tax=unclassified Brevundimonas TaxID=2622653 RepID=UPI003CE7C6E0